MSRDFAIHCHSLTIAPLSSCSTALRPAILLPHCLTSLLSHSPVTTLSYCPTPSLTDYCHTVAVPLYILPSDCPVDPLFCSFTILQPQCPAALTALLSRSHAVLMSYCPTALLSHCPIFHDLAASPNCWRNVLLPCSC
jgi:hypothetical protein